MKITPRDTVADIFRRNAALFGLGAAQITERIKTLPTPEYIPRRLALGRIRKYPARKVANITMGELKEIEKRTPSYDYFITVLAVMLGLIRHREFLPDGRPDWSGGYVIDEKTVYSLGFIRAYRYFIAIQEDIEKVANAWKKLEMPGGSKKKFPNRGMDTICRECCQLLNGAAKPEDIWHMRWSVVYEVFEGERNKNMAQREAYEAAKRKQKTVKR